MCDVYIPSHEDQNLDDLFQDLSYLENVQSEIKPGLAWFTKGEEVAIPKQFSFLVFVPSYGREVASLPVPFHGHVGQLLGDHRGACSEQFIKDIFKPMKYALSNIYVKTYM